MITIQFTHEQAILALLIVQTVICFCYFWSSLSTASIYYGGLMGYWLCTTSRVEPTSTHIPLGNKRMYYHGSMPGRCLKDVFSPYMVSNVQTSHIRHSVMYVKYMCWFMCIFCCCVMNIFLLCFMYVFLFCFIYVFLCCVMYVFVWSFINIFQCCVMWVFLSCVMYVFLCCAKYLFLCYVIYVFICIHILFHIAFDVINCVVSV